MNSVLWYASRYMIYGYMLQNILWLMQGRIRTLAIYMFVITCSLQRKFLCRGSFFIHRLSSSKRGRMLKPTDWKLLMMDNKVIQMHLEFYLEIVHTHIVIIKKGENIGTYFDDNKCDLYYFCVFFRYLLKALITHKIVLLVDLTLSISRLDPSY